MPTTVKPFGDTGPFAPAASSTTPQPRMLGRYQVYEEIAHGGMGAVLRACDPDLNRDLAVKVLKPELRDYPDLVQRFLEEAQITGQLQHPNIVPVHELGRDENGLPYLVMKLVRGQTLAELLSARASPLAELPRFVAIFEHICQALAFAHSRRVIHRDLKPLNVMVGRFGEVQVMDWGLAKVLSRPEEARQPASGAVSVVETRRPREGGALTWGALGTWEDMPPEQANGEGNRVDERADVFGLGGILCVILTGQPPFTGRSPGEIKRRAQRGDLAETFARLDACGADSGLVSLAKGCLCAEIEERPRNGGEVAGWVAAYRTEVEERRQATERERAAAEAPAEEAKATARAERRSRQRTRALAVAVLLLAGAGWWLQMREAERARERLQTADAVASAEEEARRWLGEAWERPNDKRSLVEAVAAARRAVELARRSPDDPKLLARARDLLDEAESRLQGATRREKLLLAALDVSSPHEERVERDRSGLVTMLAQPSAEEQYRRAFVEYGVDVTILAVEETERLLKQEPPAVVVEIAAALDAWSEARRRAVPAGEWRPLLELARRLDPDPERDRLRLRLADWSPNRAYLIERLGAALTPRLGWAVPLPSPERLRLVQEAQRVDAQRSPVLTVALLAEALRQAGEITEAERLLRQSWAAHPSEVVLIHRLGALLAGQRPPRWAEAVECFTAVRAVRPELGNELGNALREGGRPKESREIFEQLARIMHQYCRGCTCAAAQLVVVIGVNTILILPREDRRHDRV